MTSVRKAYALCAIRKLAWLVFLKSFKEFKELVHKQIFLKWFFLSTEMHFRLPSMLSPIVVLNQPRDLSLLLNRMEPSLLIIDYCDYCIFWRHKILMVPRCSLFPRVRAAGSWAVWGVPGGGLRSALGSQCKAMDGAADLLALLPGQSINNLYCTNDSFWELLGKNDMVIRSIKDPEMVRVSDGLVVQESLNDLFTI